MPSRNNVHSRARLRGEHCLGAKTPGKSNRAAGFQARQGDVGFNFILSTLDNTLTAAYAPAGLTNINATNATVSLPASLTINSTTYTATLNGSYYALMNSQGRAFLGVIRTPPDPFK